MSKSVYFFFIMLIWIQNIDFYSSSDYQIVEILRILSLSLSNFM